MRSRGTLGRVRCVVHLLFLVEVLVPHDCVVCITVYVLGM